MASWHNRARPINSSEEQLNTLNLSNYELAYHHQIQAAIHMGQFYNSEHHQQQHSLLRSSNTISTSSQMNQSQALINAGLGGSSGSVNVNNCLGGIGVNSLWDTGLIPGIQRNSGMPYPHIHQHHGNDAPGNSIVPHSCEIWTGAPPSSAPVAVVNGRGSGGRSGQHRSSSKKPRRRVATMAQRRAANIRERRRMFNLNEAFDKLRRKVPTFAYEKRLSRIETLRLAITYISFMGDILSVPDDGLRNGLVGKTHSNERKGTGSNHHNTQYGLLGGRSGGGSNNGNTGLMPGSGIDCHPNQNVPPAISPFTPIARMYSHHPSSTSYLHH